MQENDIDFTAAEKAIEVTFKNGDLLKQAFTHRSFINENRHLDIGHNERLEFLGDAVLELVTTEFLYAEYPKKAEGDLTAYRSALVNTITLSKAGDRLGFSDFLLMSKGEAKDTGRARQFILANTFEAIIGAIYLDQGYDKAKEFIGKNLFHLMDEILEKGLWIDSKSLFQERSQEKVSITPSYEVQSEDGPDHDKHFSVAVFLDKEKIAIGTGMSKQEAEQDAARRALNTKGWI
jgi:ribonuclease-3